MIGYGAIRCTVLKDMRLKRDGQPAWLILFVAKKRPLLITWRRSAALLQRRRHFLVGKWEIRSRIKSQPLNGMSQNLSGPSEQMGEI